MKRLAIMAVIALAVIPPAASAQTQQPYAGFEKRPIKALSQEQVDDLRAGRGMGLALAAELNGYPGPAHVLELAEPLGLTDGQRGKVQELFSAMKAETVPLGQKLLAEESTLDREFADRTISEASLAAVMHEIGSTQAALRVAHLKYHLATAAALTPVQIKRYAELRGYADGSPGHLQHGGHRH